MSNVNGESDVTPTESKTTSTVGNFPRGSRETPETSGFMEADRSEKARCRNADMHVSGESDSSIVPEKRANKDSGTADCGVVEGRGLTKENVKQLLLDRTQSRDSSRTDDWAYETTARLRHVGWSSSSKVRAVCGSSARTDLCEG